MTIGAIISTLEKLIDIEKMSHKSNIRVSNKLSRRLIYNFLIAARSTIINLDQRKNFNNEHNIQTFCVGFKPVDKGDICGIPATNCLWLKSSCPIPKPINTLKVEPLLGSFKIDLIKWYNIDDQKKSYIPGDSNFASLYSNTIDTHLYLHLSNSISSQFKKALIEGVFEDPSQVVDCCSEVSENNCMSILDKEFKIDQKLLDPILALVLERITNLWRSKIAQPLQT